jgi:carbamate kinase
MENANVPKTALIAIGGNSLITDKNYPNVSHQWDAVRDTCHHLADMIEAGWRLVITHGNGPQVGFILRRNELASETVHTTPLDVVVADTQGSIGYMLQQALRNELRRRQIMPRSVIAVVTQVIVDADDPAFDRPTKPIGGFMEEEEARKFEKDGWQVVEDSGRGWRRVVASPTPLRVLEESAIRDLIDSQNTVIAAGGGGIPVRINTNGELRDLRGVPAVIDKDLASCLLAKQLNVDLFLISTGVEQVAINFNTPEQEELGMVSAEKLTQYLNAGHFPEGSMKPKVEAVLDFVNHTGNTALITNPANLTRALKKETGTWITAA